MRNTIICGDALEVLRTLPDGLVDCVVTSPPYWGLRDYGTGEWEGGDAECNHESDGRYYTEKTAAVSSSGAFSEPGKENAERLKKGRWRESGVCIKCGALHIDQQLGLEPTLQEYIDKLVTVFREVRRVLKDEGTLWLNMGDAYCGSGGPGGDYKNGRKGMEYGTQYHHNPTGLKPKDLIGQPWRLALALQADGWWLRSDIIWAKPNPMPESVTDRPTKSHEYIFLLSKRGKYYYDAEAIKETGSENTHRRAAKNAKPSTNFKMESAGRGNRNNPSFQAAMLDQPVGTPRNKRTVWTVATQPFPEAHFATFPEKLIEPCIRAGTSEKGYCVECGKPWVRVVERTPNPSKKYNTGIDMSGGAAKTGNPQTSKGLHRNKGNAQGPPPVTIGWQPSCSCDADIVPGLVLDPFGGSGTVALEAKKLNRDFLIIELKPEYVDMANRRVKEEMGLFCESL